MPDRLAVVQGTGRDFSGGTLENPGREGAGSAIGMRRALVVAGLLVALALSAAAVRFGPRLAHRLSLGALAPGAGAGPAGDVVADTLAAHSPFTHAPSGAGWVTVRDMRMNRLPYRASYERDNASGMYYYNPEDVAGVSLRADATGEPASAPSAVRTTVPGGWRGGGGSMSRWETRKFPANDGRLYLAYTLRTSANWWHPRDDTGWKNWYLRPRGGDRNSIHFLAWVDAGNHGPGTMLPKFGTQWGNKGVDEAWSNGEYAKRVRPGEWNVVEFLITPNRDGRYDGRLDVWVNGQPLPMRNTTHGTGINWFQDGEPVGWDGVWWDMIYAHPKAVPPAEQWVEHGHVLIMVGTRP